MSNPDIFLHIQNNNEPLIGITYVQKSKFEAMQEELQESGIDLDFLFQDYFCVFIHTDHPLASKKVLTENDLKSLTLATYIEERPIDKILKPLFHEGRHYRNTSQGTIMQMVLKNRSVAVFPRLLSKYGPFAEDKRIKVLPIKLNKYESEELQVCYVLIYRNNNYYQKEMIKVIQCIKDFCCKL